MKSVKIATALLALVVFFPQCGKTEPASGSVTWLGFNEGMQKAKAQNKPAVVDFYASWCHWCKVMDRETFSNPKVAVRLKEDYITIRVDVESSQPIVMGNRSFSPNEFSMMVGVQGLPTVAFFDRDGQLITLLPGYVKTDTFLPLLDYIKSECYKQKVSFKDYMDKKAGCGK
jgi:thioredoxin-related protein